MKNNKELIVPYSEIHIGECFKCKNDGIYMKSVNGNGDIHDVNLETGLITPSLDIDVQVVYLPVVTVNTIGDW